MKHFLLGVLFLSVAVFAQAQKTSITQTVRGDIIDKDTRQPMIGASVICENGTKTAVASDANGLFKFSSVGIGRITVSISFIGYKPVKLENLLVTSGKELVLHVEMEETVVEQEAIIIKAFARKDQALNKMTSVSARSFTVEETERYAGSRGDVARMAGNYAGVSVANDQRNDIIIRGNSPSGLLWKLEDIEIPNPNHFAENGTTGGPVGMLNNNLLQNSDFLTGAFPAEYGNALSGVFDLKMRNGNNEKREYLFQVGFNGFEAGAEGPFSKNSRASYLVNYRYSTLALVQKMGLDMAGGGVPFYQDFSFKVNIPTQKGILNIFGLAGKSNITFLDEDVKDKEQYSSVGQNLYSGSDMATSGISYTRFLTEKMYWKTSVSGLFQGTSSQIDTLSMAKVATRTVDHVINEFRGTINSYVNIKHQAGFTSKFGIQIDQMGYKLNTKAFDYDSLRIIPYLKGEKNLSQGPRLYQAYYQSSLQITDNWTINPGFRFTYFSLSESWSAEPRFGISYKLTNDDKISFGYGMHSHTQSLATYYLGTYDKFGNYNETNRNLDFTRSHQFVLGYDKLINSNLRFKAETYYQKLYDVPVEQRPTYFSILNGGAGWGFSAEDSLINKGTGENVGVELTLERFLHNGFYFLTTVSVFDSKYKGSDNIERNTAFNGTYVANLLIGKEFKLNEKSSLAIDWKITSAGGKRYVPIDPAKSLQNFKAEYNYAEAFKKRLPEYFSTNFKISYRLNGKHFAQEWQFYIENVTNHQNVLYQTYDRDKNETKYVYQLGFFPMMNYRITF